MKCAFITIVAILSILAHALAAGAGQDEFLKGLDALQQQQWKDAATSFSAAIDADDENATYHTALAIASMMSNDLKTAKSEFTRALKLDPKDVPTQRWAAAYYRFIGDATTAGHIRSPADYTGTVQEAAEKVFQMKYDRVSPAEAQERWNKLYGFAIDFAARRKTGSPQLTAASSERAEKLFHDGKIDECLRDLQTVLTANPYDNRALYLEARCALAKGYLLGARELLTRVLTADTSFGAAYAVRGVVEARLGALGRADADEKLAQKIDAKSADELKHDFEQAMSASRESASSDPLDDYKKLATAAHGLDNADSLIDRATVVLLAENNHRLRWDEIYQDRLRVLEDDLRSDPKNISKLMALAEFLYNESQVPGEQLSPGGKYKPFRFSNEHTRESEITRADKLFDEVLAINPRFADALTWKAAIRLDNGNYDAGEALVNQAMQINPDSPQLLELLSRVLDETATMASYKATDLRTAKSWTQFGISYDIIWTHYPSDEELNRASALQDRANQLWANAEQSLSAAVQKMKGTADGFYYDGLLRQHQGDQQAALSDFQQAAKLDPNSNRNRQALIAALFKNGNEEEAATEKENWTLSHQTTVTVRLAKAWSQMDRTAWKSAVTSLDSALQLDPADARTAGYRAAIDSNRNKPRDAIDSLIVALALEQARVKLGGVDLSPDAKGEIVPDAGGLTMLLNLHLAWRFRDLNQSEKELATLERNLALEGRFAKNVLEIASPIAILPMPSNPNSTQPRTVSNLLAWSHVMAGYAMVDLNKLADAQKQFQIVSAWVRRDSYLNPQGLAVNDAARLRWAQEDPDISRRKQWLSDAKIINRMSDDERNLAMQLMDQAGRKAGKRMDEIQNEQFDLSYWYGATPTSGGGYDPRANPNYHGSNDNPPGMLPSQ